MANKEKSGKPFLERMRFRYRISIMDENSLEEKTFFRLSRLSLFVYVCLFTFVTFVILSILVYSTPLRYYLPGYGDAGNRETVIAEALRADSLQQQMNIKTAYLQVIKNVLRGEKTLHEIQPLDSFIVWERIAEDERLEPTERERQFIEQFEEEERFNLSIISPRVNEGIHVFFRPVRGIIERSFSPLENFFGVSVITSPNENVLSVFDGTVIFTDFSFNYGWVIHVQHNENFSSIYKNNTRLMRRVGDMVSAGETIALTGSVDGQSFYFELWHNGRPVNPEDVISF